jgi:cobalamin biosynthesis protein CobT
MGFKIKYDSSKVDRSKQGGNIPPPQPGLYRMKIAEVKQGETKGGDTMLTFVVRMNDTGKKGKAHKGYGFWDNVVMNEASAWKLDQYLQAIGIDTEKKKRGAVSDTDFINKEVMGRVKSDTYDGEYRPKLASVFPLPEDDEEEDEDEGDEDFDDEDEDEIEDDEDDEDSDDDEDDEDDEDEEDEEDEEEEDEDDEEEEDEEEEEEAPPAKPKKSASKPAPKPAAKPKAKRPPKYEDMEIEDLRAECKSRGLSTKGTKTALVARLRTNDEDPFSDD